MTMRFWMGAAAMTAMLMGPVACDNDADDGGTTVTPGGDVAIGTDTGGTNGDTGGTNGDTGGTNGDTGGATEDGAGGGGTSGDGGGTGGDATMTDGGGMSDTSMNPSDLDATWLLSIATIIAPDLPIQFIATTNFTANADPTTGGTLHFSLQPLQTAPGKATREPVGDAIEADGTVDGDGNIVLDVGTQTVVGDANPVSGSDIEATLKLLGTIKSADLACGTIEGTVSQPFQAPLTGSTWGAIVITDTTTANLPEPVGACPTEGGDVDAGSTDAGGMDAGSTDTASMDAGGMDAEAALTWNTVWAVVEPYGCLGCHSGGSGGMTMTDEASAYAALVGQASNCDGTLRVDPGNPEGSLLVKKVTPDIANCGAKMPKGSTGMDAADAQMVYDWIAAGALE